MILPHHIQARRRFSRSFVLFVLAVLIVLSTGEAGKGQALAPACSQSSDHCVYLPMAFRSPNPRIRADAVSLYKIMYFPGTQVTGVPWGGGDVSQCKAGDISQDYREVVLKRVNYYRLMAGMSSVRFRDDYNHQAQEAAMMMSRNGEIRYEPPVGWACQTPDGLIGARWSNSLGKNNGPAAVDIYVSDKYEAVIPNTTITTYPVGHRRYMLFPQTQEMGDGDIPATGDFMAVNSLRVFDDHYPDAYRPPTRDAFVAWPPAAYVPYQVVFPLWSFSYANADFSLAAVTMSSAGKPLSVTLYPPLNGQGENTLVWKAGQWDVWPKPGADTSYVVIIHNVLIGGQKYNFTYTVTVIDPG